MAATVAVLLIVRDADGNDAGVIVGHTRLETRDALNKPGGWTLELDPANPAVAALRTVGAGIAVVDDTDTVTFSGPVAPSADGIVAATRTTTAATDSVRFSGPSDLGCLWWRRCIPPVGASHLEAAGPFGAAAAAIVDSQIGEAADPDRRLAPWRVLPTAVGDTVTLSGRYQPVGDLLNADIGDLVMSARWTTSGPILFTVKERVSKAFPLSVSAGTIEVQTVDDQPETRSVVYALGQGEGAARAVAVAGSLSSPWSRVEDVIDRRDIETTGGLETAAAAALGDPARSIAVRLAADYGLEIGDTVNVDVWGAEIELPVSEVQTIDTPNASTRSVSVGDPSPTQMLRIIEAARRTVNPQT